MNGFAERKNKTFCEAACAMINIFHFGLKLKALLSLFKTSVFIRLGRYNSRRNKNPLVYHLRIFGSPVYIHVPKENKINPSRKKGSFVEYSETSKAYRIYVEVSEDVTFHEEVSFRRSENFFVI
jgi:hypothetical protein